MESLAKKTCKICCMEIPAGAKRCPFCQYWQKPFLGVLYHPATGLFFMLIFYGILIGYACNSLFSIGESFTHYSDSIHVVESKIELGESQSGPTVAILGTVHNASPFGWKDLVFHADIFDADGKLADMGQERMYSYVLPAGKTQSFKITFSRQFPAEKYVKYKINVVSAKDACSIF